MYVHSGRYVSNFSRETLAHLPWTCSSQHHLQWFRTWPNSGRFSQVRKKYILCLHQGKIPVYDPQGKRVWAFFRQILDLFFFLIHRQTHVFQDLLRRNVRWLPHGTSKLPQEQTKTWPDMRTGTYRHFLTLMSGVHRPLGLSQVLLGKDNLPTRSSQTDNSKRNELLK